MTLNLTVKCSTGQKLSVTAETSQTVLELKQKLQEESGIASEQMRLIYRGHVLKDGNTLESYCECLLNCHMHACVAYSAPRMFSSTQDAWMVPTWTTSMLDGSSIPEVV